jgi:hypothetical protein
MFLCRQAHGLTFLYHFYILKFDLFLKKNWGADALQFFESNFLANRVYFFFTVMVMVCDTPDGAKT